MGSDEFLSPGESIAINDAMVTKTTNLQQENMKTTLEVQLLLSDVKNAVNNIGEILGPVLEIIYRHSKRFKKARDIVFVALDKTFKINDSELEVSNDVVLTTCTKKIVHKIQYYKYITRSER